VIAKALLRYCLVGVVNTALSLAVDAALLRAGVPVAPAAGLAFAAGAACGYELNRRVTFGAARSAGAATAYAAVAAGGLLLDAALVDAAVRAGLQPLAAYVLVLPVVTVATFTANRSLTFRRSVDALDRLPDAAVAGRVVERHVPVIPAHPVVDVVAAPEDLEDLSGASRVMKRAPRDHEDVAGAAIVDRHGLILERRAPRGIGDIRAGAAGNPP
jgi:putative flippase GtrA